MATISTDIMSKSLQNHEHQGEFYWVAYHSDKVSVHNSCSTALRTRPICINEMQICCIGRLADLIDMTIFFDHENAK